MPVLIRAGALGPGRPARDLVVSAQHRVLIGGFGQVAGAFGTEALVPAKALTGLPGVRLMHGRRSADWVHFALRRHAVVLADGCATESLLLAPMVMNGLPAFQRRRLEAELGPVSGGALNGPPARPLARVREARDALNGSRHLAA